MTSSGFFAAVRKSSKARVVLFVALISAINYCYSYTTYPQSTRLKVAQPATWISLAVCTEGSTHLHGKYSTPYLEFALVASELWIHLSARVILQLVSKEGDSSLPPHVKDYPTTLLIKGLKTYENMSCHTSSQVARMFVHEYAEVNPWDIVITADADALPCSRDVLKPIHSSLRYKAWIWQHFHSEESGYTFPMSFIGLRAIDWQKLLCTSNEEARNCVNDWLIWDKRTFNDLQPAFTWGLDQRIVTRALLEQSICCVGNKAVWNHVKLDYKDFLDDNACFHGQRINSHVDSGGSSWVHMYPDSTLRDAEILAGMVLSLKGCPATARGLSETNSLP